MRFNDNYLIALVISLPAITLDSVLQPVSASSSIEEVIVTAQRREQNIQDVPISITALSGEKLQSVGITNYMGLQDVTPGFQSNSTGGFANPVIRGIGANLTTPGNDSPIATYIDGVYISDKSSAFANDFGDVERIEVLKGPQGTLYGRNSTGGAINITTKAPSREFAANFEATYGRFDDRRIRGYVTGSLTESLSASLGGFYNESDGWINVINPTASFDDEDAGRTEGTGVRGKLLWEPTADLKVTLAAEYVDTRNNFGEAWQPVGDNPVTVEYLASIGALPPSLALVSRKPRDYASDVLPEVTSETVGGSITVEWNVDLVNIKSITSYREYDYTTVVDLDSSPAPIFYFDASGATESFQQEIQFSSVDSDSRFSWVAGLYYLQEDAGYPPNGNVPGVTGALNAIVAVPYPVSPANLQASLANGGTLLSWYNQQEVEAMAAFGELTYDFTDSTSVTLGARYSREKTEVLEDGKQALELPNAAGTAYVTPPLIIAQMVPGVGETFTEPTWSVVLKHNFSDAIMAYASYKRGFKSGVYNLSDLANTTPTEPEIIDAYELGFKTDILEGILRLNGAFYYYDYSELQVTITDFNTGGQFTENAASAEVNGVELSADWNATDNLLLNVGLSWIDGEYEDYVGATLFVPDGVGGLATQAGDLSGAELPYTQNFTASVGVNYFIPLDNGSNIVLAGNWYHSSSYLLAHSPHITQDSFDRVNVSATWNSSNNRYYLRLWGNNILDEDIHNGIQITPFGAHDSYQAPATYGVTVGAKFGE